MFRVAAMRFFFSRFSFYLIFFYLAVSDEVDLSSIADAENVLAESILHTTKNPYSTEYSSNITVISQYWDNVAGIFCAVWEKIVTKVVCVNRWNLNVCSLRFSEIVLSNNETFSLFTLCLFSKKKITIKERKNASLVVETKRSRFCRSTSSLTVTDWVAACT